MAPELNHGVNKLEKPKMSLRKSIDRKTAGYKKLAVLQ
jgi:hypothetical protein